MMAVDCDSDARGRYEKAPEIVTTIKEDQELERKDQDSTPGAANHENEVEFFSRAGDFGGSKNHLRICEVKSRYFLADCERLKSSSEDWKSWEHLSGVEGKKDEVDKEPESVSVYPSQNLTRCQERLVDFSENGEGLDSVSGDLKKCSELQFEAEEKNDLAKNDLELVHETHILRASEDAGDEFDAIRDEQLKSIPEDSKGWLQDQVEFEEAQDTKQRKKESDYDIQDLRRCEERPRNFEKIAEKLQSVSENVREWLETLPDPPSVNSGRCNRLLENGKNIESNSGHPIKGLENHCEVEQRHIVVGKQFESDYGTRRLKEPHGMFDTFKEKLISLSEDAKRCPGKWLVVADGQDAVVKESLQSAFMIQDSERAGNLSDMGRSVSFSNDAIDCVEYQFQAELKEDVVACRSTSLENPDSSRLQLNHMSFLLVNEMQETEVKVIGFSSQAPDLGKNSGARSFKERLGGASMNKEKKDVSETEVRPILQAQEEGKKITKGARNSVSGDRDFFKQNDPLSSNLNSTGVFSDINGVCGISNAQNAVRKLNCRQSCSRGPSHRKQMREMNHEAKLFYSQQKQSILGICPGFSSKAGSGRRMNEKGPKVSGRSDESFSYKYSKQEMLKNKVKCGDRKPGRDGSEADGKGNDLCFVDRIRTTYVKRGERPTRRYPRSKLLALRYVNIEQQKRRWNEIYQGLSPLVAQEYNQIAACYNQKQCHRSADWPPPHNKKNKHAEGFPSGLQTGLQGGMAENPLPNSSAHHVNQKPVRIGW